MYCHFYKSVFQLFPTEGSLKGLRDYFGKGLARVDIIFEKEEQFADSQIEYI